MGMGGHTAVLNSVALAATRICGITSLKTFSVDASSDCPLMPLSPRVKCSSPSWLNRVSLLSSMGPTPRF
jgi:hypothetical protein